MTFARASLDNKFQTFWYILRKSLTRLITLDKLFLEEEAGDGNNCWFGVKGYWIVAPDDKLVEVYYLNEALLQHSAFIKDKWRTSVKCDHKGEYPMLKTYSENDIIESQIIKGLKIELNRVFA